MTRRRPELDTLMLAKVHAAEVREYIGDQIREVLSSLPDTGRLSAAERRGIIARYTAVLEGNFIYWMTATYLSVQSPVAHAIIKDNLLEEVRDNHPGMLRRFAVAARATSTDEDRAAVDRDLQTVRAFVAGMRSLEIVLMMAFFEGFIARFMPYLQDLAARSGSDEREYTEVHGVVDIGHTQELFRAFESELLLINDLPPANDLFAGVGVLRTLIATVIHHRPAVEAANASTL